MRAGRLRSGTQQGAAKGMPRSPQCRVAWTRLPLDWMVEEEAALDEVGDTLVAIGREWDVDLLHLNLPSQAAMIADGLPVVVTSHSCIATWWQAVRGNALPPDVAMAANVDQARSHACGRGHDTDQQPWRRIDRVLRADATICMSSLTQRQWRVRRMPTNRIVFAAGRWWDEGKNASTLDAAAAQSRWPVVMAGAVSGPNGQNVRLQHARSLGELSASAHIRLDEFAPGSLPRPRSTNRSALRCSRLLRVVRHWCSPTSRHSASCGTKQRCSCEPTMRKVLPPR